MTAPKRSRRYLRQLSASRRAPRTAAAAVGRTRARRDAVHRHPSGLRALVQGAAPRARSRAQLLTDDDPHRAQHTLKRILTILKVMVAQLDILETMTPLEFLSFRRGSRRRADSSRISSGRSSSCSAPRARRRSRRFPRAAAPARRSSAVIANQRSGTPSFITSRAKATRSRVAAVARRRRPIEPSAGGAAASSSGCTARPEERRALRAARRSRRGRAGVAISARQDGGAHDRREAGNRRLHRRGIPPQHRRPQSFPDLWEIRARL